MHLKMPVSGNNDVSKDGTSTSVEHGYTNTG
jgi:hypothetical protein